MSSSQASLRYYGRISKHKKQDFIVFWSFKGYLFSKSPPTKNLVSIKQKDNDKHERSSTCIRGVIPNVNIQLSVKGAYHQEGKKHHHNKVAQKNVVSAVTEMRKFV